MRQLNMFGRGRIPEVILAVPLRPAPDPDARCARLHVRCAIRQACPWNTRTAHVKNKQMRTRIR